MPELNFERIKSHLEQKWKGKCPMCGEGSWQVTDKLFQLTEFFEEGTVLGGRVAPVLPVSCQNCGYTALVSPLIARLVDPPASSDSDVGESGKVETPQGEA